MENMSNISFPEAGVLEDQIISSNAQKVSSTDVNSSAQNVHELENLDFKNTLIISAAKVVTETKYMNEVSLDNEDLTLDDFENDSKHVAELEENQLPVKTLSPTIFENAVKVVKNLFSPAKGHGMGIFSRGTSQQDNKQTETKKLSNGEIKVLNGNVASRIEQLATAERKRPLSVSNFDNNLGFNEEDAFSLVAKHFSNSVDAHNNTNDSYTSTVSRMDESFQSTVTHFDDCMQNEVVISNNLAASIENISMVDSSLNDTIDANENSLNNTLKKNISSSITENGELNATFEGSEFNEFISRIENKGIDSIDARSLHERSSPRTPNVQDSKVSQNVENSLETAKEALELITDIVTSREAEGNRSLTEENLTDIRSSSTPNKQQSFGNTNLINSPFSNIFPETLSHLKQKKAENINEDSYGCTPQDTDAQNEGRLTLFSIFTHSSEMVCSDSSTSDNYLLDKRNSPALCTSLEKNFSTSTIVISKNDFDSMNSSKEKSALVPKHQISLVEQESLINSDIKAGNSEDFTVTEQEHSDEVFINNKEETDLCLNKPEIILDPAHFNMTEFLKNCPPESKPFNKLDIEKPHTSKKPVIETVIETFDQNFESLNLMENNFFSESELELKSGECPINEVEIPLASQKSYTVLHNLNPDLNLPVVSVNTCDVEADKLNDIILGNRAFSDLNVLCNKDVDSERIITLNQIDASTSDFAELNTDKIFTDTVQNVDFDDTDLNPCYLETPNKISPAHNLEFDNSPSLSSLESHTAAIVESEKDISKNVGQKESLSATNLSNSASELSNISEKTPKNESSIIKPENSAAKRGNSPETDILFLAGKTEDKTNKKSNSILELTPLVGTISGDEAGAESSRNNMISSFICSNGNYLDSLSSDNFDVPIKTNDFTGSTHVKDFCTNEEAAEELSLNAESKHAENMESEGKDTVENDFETPTLQTDLDNVISDLERLKMNDSATEAPNKCYSDSDNPFSITSKLNDTENSYDEGDLSEKNVVNALNSVSELSQFIQEQFTVTDIEKICSVVDVIPELNLSKNIAIASEQFDKSFHGKILNESGSNVMKVNNPVIKNENDLDFLDSIKGKPSTRDYSRESLYIKFDPLVQSKHSSTLLDISEGDKENVIALPITRNNNTLDSLIPITPLKQNINSNSVSPLTPTSQNNESKLSTEKLNKLRELQNEISRLRECYLQREELHKEKMNNYENVISELRGKASVLEDKLKESEEMEKLLLKKLNTQNESMSRLRTTIEECMTYISKLTDELQKSRKDNQKQISVLKEERDYYMNHLQMTEQAFSDVFKKYEKCKEAVKTYKKNEDIYKLNIDNMKDRIEQYSEKIRSMQESAAKEVSKLQEKINDLKLNQTQEVSKFKAQLRITELKVQTMQEALEQKIKENQELAGICDELIESKECDR